MFYLDPSYQENISILMHERREDAIKRLKKVISSELAENFAIMLHYSWQEGLEQADTVMDSIDFNPIDFAAIALDHNEFDRLLMEEMERTYG